ncbi:hypothetical protein MTR67_024378 [Solanum verrucosum]|uniref:Serine carboxypeptidase-like 18 n=1 Tax=Solanum verrucosum TaxID=315347 RepID=A0AAF0QYW6_SOLVR|nr:hypothetical protein MTR67_024378 [Solanum verrucosum]
MCWLPILILIVAFEIICLQPALAGLSVKHLPGFERPLPFQLETGYIGVGETDEDPLHWTLELIMGACNVIFKSICIHKDISRSPSSHLTRHSPIYLVSQVASMIFVDLPVGTGFSYATTQKANYSDDLQSANHAYEFLRKWLIEHQEYLNNPFYVAGDSYSGITVPIVTQVISNGIDRGIKPWINLKGYILGNPLTFAGQDYYRIPFAHGMGLIPDELYKSLVTNCEEESIHNGPTNPLCSRDMHTFKWLTKDIYQYNILESPCELVSNDSRRWLTENVLKLKNSATYPQVKCRKEWRHDLSLIWANDNIVRDALHVRKVCNFNNNNKKSN